MGKPLTAGELFEQNMDWADDIAKLAGKTLPPCFDVEDLMQEARIGLWKASESYNASLGVPFRAWAWFTVRGAVFMSVRRKGYSNATMDVLPDVVVDKSDSVLEKLIEAEQDAQDHAKRERQYAALITAMAVRLPSESYIAKRIMIDKITICDLAVTWRVEEKQIKRRLYRAGREIRKGVKV